MNATHTLDSFYNNRGNLVSLCSETGLQGSLVIKREKYDVFSLINRGNEGRIVRSRYCQRSPSVERSSEGDDLFPAIMKGCQLERIFIGFRTGIAKK